MNGVDYPTALVLGLIQGLTEFLPVSSSAHLVIAQKLYGLDGSAAPVLLFDLVAHVGTVASMWIVFATPLWRFIGNLGRELTGPPARKRFALTVAGLAVVASAATAAIGFGFKDAFERSFDSLAETGAGLIITGTLLFVIGRIGRPRRGWRRIGWWRAALIGLAQGAAISPGVSRSGATICIALLLGIKRRWAAEFSFLIAVPAILGATAIKFSEAMHLPAEELAAVSWGAMIAGAGVALVTGVVALRFVMRIVVQDKLSYFSFYCWAVGIAALFYA